MSTPTNSDTITRLVAIAKNIAESGGISDKKPYSNFKTLSFFTKHTITAVILTAVMTGCGTRQLLVVKPIEKSKAVLYFYEDGKKLYETSANIGRNGVAEDGKKREGDGKTPFGIYEITTLFGYGDNDVDMPYIKADENVICVDDVASENYNRIVDRRDIKTDYSSFEDMKRNDAQYEYGAVIAYNETGVKGAGSCIFIHVEKQPNSPTAGCVSLKIDDMKRLFFGENRLHAAKKPSIAILKNSEEFERFISDRKILP